MGVGVGFGGGTRLSRLCGCSCLEDGPGGVGRTVCGAGALRVILQVLMLLAVGVGMGDCLVKDRRGYCSGCEVVVASGLWREDMALCLLRLFGVLVGLVAWYLVRMTWIVLVIVGAR